MAKIALYLISTGMLAALVASCMWVFSLNPRSTKQRDGETINSTNPVLSFSPTPDNNESTLIWLQRSDQRNYKKWNDKLMSFLDVYYNPAKVVKADTPIRRCSYDILPLPGQVCDVDIREWEPCNRESYFSYHRDSPCVFLKLNDKYGWKPEFYNDPNDLPDEMPQQLKDHIKYNITRPEQRNKVWISCIGETPADKEYLGPVAYYPSNQGFPGYYYPYMNTEGYFSPLVAVQFKRPSRGMVINIECRAWAKNIKYNTHDKGGSVHFELLID